MRRNLSGGNYENENKISYTDGYPDCSDAPDGIRAQPWIYYDRADFCLLYTSQNKQHDAHSVFCHQTFRIRRGWGHGKDACRHREGNDQDVYKRQSHDCAAVKVCCATIWQITLKFLQKGLQGNDICYNTYEPVSYTHLFLHNLLESIQI